MPMRLISNFGSRSVETDADIMLSVPLLHGLSMNLIKIKLAVT